MISRKVLRCLILIAEEAIRSVISEMVYIDFFSLISIKMRLVRVTELDDDRYIYHIGKLRCYKVMMVVKFGLK